MVTLITPPSEFLLDERVFMSLGILKVAASLEAVGEKVNHLDLSGVENFMDVVAEYAQNADKGTVYGLTATTPQMPSASKIAAFLKPFGKVILGGPHATLVNAAAKRETVEGRATLARNLLLGQFDSVVAGDGELAIGLAIRDTGLIDADDHKSSLWQTSADFEISPLPARHLVDVKSYHYEVDGEPALSMISQLGCPFECGFCGGRLSPMLRRIRTRTSQSVIQEMMHLHENYGVKGIMFYDDELNVNRGMVELMQNIQGTPVDWRLRGFVKAELFTEEQAGAMYSAGFRWLLCGFESADPIILRNINKKATRADNTNMLRIAHRNGLKVKALMSCGHPGESEKSILNTRDWLLEEKPDDFDLTIITTYPGTAYYDSAKRRDDGVYEYNTWGNKLYSHDPNYTTDAQYYKGKPGEYKSYVWTDHLTPERLVELRDMVEADVRAKLGIPYPHAQTALRYEHSMGMNHISPQILRTK